MKVILLEIDSSKKEMLLSKLNPVDILAMKTCEKDLSPRASHKYTLKKTHINPKRQRIEIYVEQNSISRIIKTIVTLARDGFFPQSPVEVISIRSAI